MAANGALKTGDYVQSKEEGGWSVSVKSTGEVKATANGADVSGQVSDSSSSGFKWSDIIAKRQNAKATADEVALKTLTYAATQADLARAEAKKDEKTDAPATVSAISAGQIALQALTQGRTLDTSA
jgi:butyrate kinase